MRSGCVVLLMLLASMTMSSAQEPFKVLPTVQTIHSLLPANQQARLGAEAVVARLMSFDQNRDGKIVADELAERMEGLLSRGDRNGDAALDASEVRMLSESPQTVQTAFRNLSGGYGFGDSVGQSSRSHIENSIDDLRLAPQVHADAKRIGVAFAEQLEAAALANLRSAIAPLLTPAQMTQFETDLTRLAGARTFQIATNGTRQIIAVGVDPTFLLRRHQLPAEQMKTATAAVEAFRAAQQLDEPRREALVTQLSSLLSDEEQENLAAALARRPLVKGAGVFAIAQGVHAVQGVQNVQAVVREAVLRDAPAAVQSVQFVVPAVR
jgi:hypothetical protein